ncbi:HIT-like protein [Eremomyces bilateralis CBS 781.70]|uniref:HIT-like protein n=1 Tax=Eremomyces bilateralis CBS 781.70 TaxID=1392243 RepID=A0A6G1GCY2_9PEZI|nr:HIT-like protein [Eremomyces bilateralis CBS 781.70]KAF1815719.1 HIT-like protein [Eremomyces bilateralis CBS 781.70]
MSRKPEPSNSSPTPGSKKGHLKSDPFRFVLRSYIQSPTTQPADTVIYHNDYWVFIQDKFPKSQIHCLLVSRDPAISELHPCTALSKPKFLAAAREEVKRAKSIVAAEARRRWGTTSAKEKARRDAMEKLLESADEIGEDKEMSPEERQAELEAQLPSGRDWESEILVGVHAHPSLYNVHIHILTPDRFSEKMKHKKHYNSFQTRFLVGLDEFPLPEDQREGQGRGRYLKGDLECWRCKKKFGSHFAELKRHLEEEYEDWRQL